MLCQASIYVGPGALKGHHYISGMKPSLTVGADLSSTPSIHRPQLASPSVAYQRHPPLVVILSAAKDLTRWVTKFFAALNMTGLSHPCPTVTACGLSTRRPTRAHARLRLMHITADLSAPVDSMMAAFIRQCA